MSPQLQLVLQERRFYFIGRTKREVIFTVLAATLDEARQKFRVSGRPDSDASSSSKPKPKSISPESNAQAQIE